MSRSELLLSLSCFCVVSSLEWTGTSPGAVNPEQEESAPDTVDLLQAKVTTNQDSATGDADDDKAKTTKIPFHVIFTSQFGFQSLPQQVQANINHTIDLNPGITVRWFTDTDCRQYITQHCTSILGRFEEEKTGAYRGDACRTCILAREGGYYVDLDVEMHRPFDQFAGPNTTFASIWSGQDDNVFNAVIAATPGNRIMGDTIDQISNWYRHNEFTGHLGPVATRHALLSVPGCGQLNQQAREGVLDMVCDTEHVRMYVERFICNSSPGHKRCQSEFLGGKYGIFAPKDPDDNYGVRDAVAYSRFQDCKTWGCENGGDNDVLVDDDKEVEETQSVQDDEDERD